MVNITKCGFLLTRERAARLMLQLSSRKVGCLQFPLKFAAIPLLLSLLGSKVCEVV